MWGSREESVMCGDIGRNQSCVGDLGRNQSCVGSREESVMCGI